jgi:hypothetical protein
VDDNAITLRNHRWEQGAIEANRRHQVLVQLLGPFRIVERSKPAAWSTRATQHVDEDVDAPELPQRRADDGIGAFRS